MWLADIENVVGGQRGRGGRTVRMWWAEIEDVVGGQ